MATGKGAAIGGIGDEFPILCDTCLGPSPYVRMTRHARGSACKVCERPFTSFRWRPAGQGTRPKKTEVCQTCARAKNVCQTCLLDLQFGLPVQVRDASLAIGDRQRTVVPQSDGTREYTAAQAERAIANGEMDKVYKAPMVNNVAERAKRVEPRYERNRARVCSFFLKGTCTRGLYCPYRHEKEERDEEDMSEQNIRDRYYGVNDPVAAKIFGKFGMSSDGKRKLQGKIQQSGDAPPVPEDPNIRTLFIGGVKGGITEAALRNHFSGVNGLARVSVMSERGIAFIDFETREAAEEAMRKMHGPQELNGARIFVNWGRGSGNKRERPQEHDPKSPRRQGNSMPRLVRDERPPSLTAQANPVPKRPRLGMENRIENNGVGEGRGREIAASFATSVPVKAISAFPEPTDVALKSKGALPTFPAFPPSSNAAVRKKGALPLPLRYASQNPGQFGSAVQRNPTLRENDI